MSEAEILIVSTKVDPATDDVAQRLGARGLSFFRLNTEDYPFEGTIAFEPASTGNSKPRLAYNGRPVENPAAIWYRRLRAPATPEGMDEGVAIFCRQETRAAILGSMLGQRARWMSHPSAIWEAEFKPYQLQVAAGLGITIPPSIITNDPGCIHAAFRQFGSMVVKPVRSGHLIRNGTEHSIYTSQLLAEHLDDLESARWSPAIYQPLIPKRHDLRVTLVGDTCFAAAIDSQSDPAASVDWRQTNNPDLPHYPVSLPAELESALHRLMKTLRLTFGAIDFIETPDGDYVFLEVNPNGQWLWLDDMLNLGISDAVADWLGRGRES